MSTLATLTRMGRAAIAKAILERPLHLAWGTGDAAWDVEGATLPSLVDATALAAEVGRRTVSASGFVEPSDTGGIVIPVGVQPDGSVEEARYAQVAGPTPYIYVRVNYDFTDANNAIIREMGVFMDTMTAAGLPAGQQYFTPGEIADPGLLLATQIISPAISRSPSVRQTVEFVLPI